MDQMCAASESSCPRGLSQVALTLLHVLVPPSESLKLPWVLGARDDSLCYACPASRIFLMIMPRLSVGSLHITRIDP